MSSLRPQGHGRLLGALCLILVSMGVLAWLLMPRQEDPSFPARYGLITVDFPGADAPTVERLIVEPLEQQLVQVDEVHHVDSTSAPGAAVLNVELRPDIYATVDAWERVRRSIERAQAEFPEGVQPPRLRDDLVEPDSIVLAVTGSDDLLALRSAAQRVKEVLIGVNGVSTVELVADPGQQLTIEYDAAQARHTGVDHRRLAAQLQGRNARIPGGTIRVGASSVSLDPQSDFDSIEELAKTRVVMNSGAAVPLSEVADIRHTVSEPAAVHMRHHGQASVGLRVVIRRGMNIVEVGEQVRQAIERLRLELDPLELRELAFQPDQVGKRIDELGWSLLSSVVIVALALCVMMGARLGLVVAALVPLVALAALAVFWVGGGTLHQISIAGIVIALGMLVDNAIVVAEQVQRGIDQGQPPVKAARAAFKALRVPLTTATATTLAAFIPMLLASGPTSDFVRTLPIVIGVSLALSLGLALSVTPRLSAWLLRPRARAGSIGPMTRWVSIPLRAPKLVLAATAGLVVLSVACVGLVEHQFFPVADRNQLVVELRHPAGTHIDVIDESARVIEQALAQDSDVADFVSYVGRGTPRFYYNLMAEPRSPGLAQVVVTTIDRSRNEAVAGRLRDLIAAELSGVDGVVRRLEQGPTARAPVEVRVFSEDPSQLHTASDAVLDHLRRVPGAIDVRRDLDQGIPTIEFDVIDSSAAVVGVAAVDVARAVLSHTRGLPIGEYRGGEEGIPIVLRASKSDRLNADQLGMLEVSNAAGAMVPVAQTSRIEADWRPAVIHHRDRRRVTRVLAQTEGASFSSIVAQLERRLDDETLPDGAQYEIGGAAESAQEANGSLFRALPVGIIALLVCLMLEFRSFRRVALILATVPLAAVGIIPGLIVGQQPFGFMSLLGTVALAGIVVNNAIVLIDMVDGVRARGASVDDALREALEVRIRPIVLTTVTTILGLIPLLFTSSTLWPPLAWAMISGLLGSTLLTVVVVPSMYRLLFRERSPRVEAEFEDSPTLPLVLVPPPNFVDAASPTRPTAAANVPAAIPMPVRGAATTRYAIYQQPDSWAQSV